MAYYLENEELLDRAGLERLQRRKLSVLLRSVRGGTSFYGRKLAGIAFDSDADDIEMLPLTNRRELEEDQAACPPYGTLPVLPLGDFTRYHQTSGSSGTPLRWLDTPASWAWWRRCWSIVYRAAGVTDGDRFLLPFSFGPFVGFWCAFESAVSLGNLAIPGGGMSTAARLRMMVENAVTVVCCTPTYALRMAEVAGDEGIDLVSSSVRLVIVAGEPGGGLPSVRARIESAWGARLIDHAGMTEVGAWGLECEENPGGLHVIESEFVAEVVDPSDGRVLADGCSGELVLTNLGRLGMPLIRYRTGDEATLTRGRCACGRWFARIEGGIRGRVDDMVFVRGNNVFPSAIEGIVRERAEVVEFRMTLDERGPLSEMRVEIECAVGVATEAVVSHIAREVRDRLYFGVSVAVVAPGSLPRFELKGKRFRRLGT